MNDPKGGVLRVVGQNGGGGARVHVYQLNSALEARGVRTTTLIPPPSFSDPLTSQTLVKFSYEHTAGLRRTVQLAGRLRPDYIHSHLRNATVWAAAASFAHDIPHIVTVHTPVLAEQLTFREFAFRHLIARALKSAKLVIFISEFIRHLTLRQLGLRDADLNSAVVHNGSSRTATAGASSAGDSVLRVAMVGELTPRKGINELIELATLLSSDARIRFHLYGDGPLRGQVEAAAAKLGNIEVHGYIREQSDIYAVSQINMMLGKSEAFGRTVTEAKSFGVPTLAFNAGAFPELIEHGRTGILVDTVAAAAQALSRLADMPDDLQSMGKLAAEDFENRFTEQIFAARTLEVIASALGDARSAR